MVSATATPAGERNDDNNNNQSTYGVDVDKTTKKSAIVMVRRADAVTRGCTVPERHDDRPACTAGALKAPASDDLAGRGVLGASIEALSLGKDPWPTCGPSSHARENAVGQPSNHLMADPDRESAPRSGGEVKMCHYFSSSMGDALYIKNRQAATSLPHQKTRPPSGAFDYSLGH